MVKDPRLCRLLPLWAPVIAGSALPLVMVLRHPAAVAASLSARDGFSPDKALMLWLVNNLEMERESRAFQREFILYSELLRDPGPFCRRLQQRLKLPELDVGCLIQDRLRADLCHHDETWPVASAKLRDWCLTVFETLKHGKPEEGVLDQIYQDYEECVGWLPDEFSGLAETTLRHEMAKMIPKPELHMQVFADQVSQSASTCKEIVPDEWQTIRFEHLENHQVDPARRLRIDPVNHRGFVTLSRIRIFREDDRADLYLAETDEAFRKIEFTSELLPCFEKSGLVLLAMDQDPQMLLPSFGALPQAACTLEVTLRVEIADAQLLQQFGELHGIREGHAKLRSEHEKLRAEKDRLVSQLLQQLGELHGIREEHTTLRGEHEELRAERDRLVSQIESLQTIVDSANRWQKRS
jgi:hypothetical protein